MTTPKTRCVIYVRISNDATGQKAGVTRQLKECTALAERLQWSVVDVYTDNDISAFDGSDRPGFEALLESIERGEITGICVWHPNRLYRRMKDLERLVDLADGGVEITSVVGGEIDLSNASGRMTARILGSVAQQESEHKGERQRSANADRATAGKWRADGARPFGYTQRGAPLEPEAQAVRDAAQAVLNGVSLRSICMDWNRRELFTPVAQHVNPKTGKQRGGVKWSNLQLGRLLQRPVYAGYRTYKDAAPIRGDWEPLYDRDTWQGLVALLSDESRRPASRFVRLHMGSGVYSCGKCGGKLYAGFPHGRNKMLYLCRQSNDLGRVGEPIDTIVEATAIGVLTRDGMHERLTVKPGIDVQGLNAKRAGLVAQKKQLAAWFTSGVLDAEGVEAESAKLTTQVAGIDQTLREASRRSTAATLLVDGPSEVWRHWGEASPDLRGKVVAELMTVTVMPSKRGAKVFDPDLIDIQPLI